MVKQRLPLVFMNFTFLPDDMIKLKSYGYSYTSATDLTSSSSSRQLSHATRQEKHSQHLNIYAVYLEYTVIYNQKIACLVNKVCFTHVGSAAIQLE